MHHPTRWLPPIAAGVLAVAIALTLTWPLGAHLDEGVPLGTEPAATVALFNLWTLWWNADRAAALYDGYWQAPIFHPTGGSFALSDPQPLPGLVAALLSPALSPVARYNLLLLATLALNGILAYRLAVELGVTRGVALLAVPIVQTLPFLLQELGVIQLLALWGPLWTLLATLRLAAAPSMRRGALLGVALAATFLSCAYYGLFMALLVPAVLVWWLPRLWRSAALWKGAALAAVTATALTLPVAGPQRAALSELSLARPASVVSSHSATARDYLEAPRSPPLPIPVPAVESAPGRRAFWPRTICVGLGAAGIALAWRRRTRPVLALVGLGAIALMLSLGPESVLGGVYRALGFVPGVGQLRSPFRFAVLTQLAIAFLAVLGLDEIVRRAPTRPLARRAIAGLTALLGILCVTEGWPTGPARIQALPPLTLRLAWLDWIERHTAPDDVLAFLPFPEGRSSPAYEGTTQWMYWQTRHGRPMVNGYSGFFPPRFLALKRTLRTFPSAEGAAALRDRGVAWVVAHRAFFSPSDLVSRGGLRPVFSDPESGIDIYALPRER